ncbi:hypothetical protein [Streptomyces capparidis]
MSESPRAYDGEKFGEYEFVDFDAVFDPVSDPVEDPELRELLHLVDADQDQDQGPLEPPVVTFRGGPMDGHRISVAGWTPAQRREGVAHICDEGTEYGLGGRAWYSPPEDHPRPEQAEVWTWEGNSA